MRSILIGALALVAFLGSPSRSGAEESVSRGVVKASQLLEQGEYVAAEKRIRRALIGLVDERERAEAFRVLGLSLFHQARTEEARASFLDYLRRDPDAHLDPALVPPEAITLFEDVRARNLSEIEALRPKPKKKRYLLLNLVPAGGQFQNGDRGKGIAVAVGIGTLLAANLGSYYWLKKNCDAMTRVCGDATTSEAKTARQVQSLNQLSGVAVFGLYAYSVIDGLVGYKRGKQAERTPAHMGLSLLPTDGGVEVGWLVNF